MPPPLPVESEGESVADLAPAKEAIEVSQDPKLKEVAEEEEDGDDAEEEGDEEVYEYTRLYWITEVTLKTYVNPQTILQKQGLTYNYAGTNEIPSKMERLREKIRSHLGNRREPSVRPPPWCLEFFQGFFKPTNPFGRGASEVLKAYWASIGGKPVAGAPKSSKKRSRQSGASAKGNPDTTKRQRLGKGGRKSNGAIEQDSEPGGLVGFIQVGEDNWKPPTPKDGSWDPLIQGIDTVIRENNDGELWAYMIWNEKNEAGRFYRSRARLPVIYKACPQRMLHFYEKHLVFSESHDVEGADPVADATAETA
ncbi:MAG: hypothetical protein Q9163_004764 [Psora crenata]